MWEQHAALLGSVASMGVQPHKVVAYGVPRSRPLALSLFLDKLHATTGSGRANNLVTALYPCRTVTATLVHCRSAQKSPFRGCAKSKYPDGVNVREMAFPSINSGTSHSAKQFHW